MAIKQAAGLRAQNRTGPSYRDLSFSSGMKLALGRVRISGHYPGGLTLGLAYS